MPELTEQQIKDGIADHSIAAITLDTNVFDRYGCSLGFPVLRKLDQFRDSDIHFVLSDIVRNEVINHIATEADETSRLVRKAFRDHGRRWALPDADRVPAPGLRLDDDPRHLAATQMADYIVATDCEVIAPTDANDVTAEVLQRYFASQSPFESKLKKKSEFPDAFALCSLESHAHHQNIHILCVSSDKGWRDFCAASVHLVCINDLERALSYFNETGAAFAATVVGLLRQGNTQELVDAVESALESRLDDCDFHADGWSSVEFETEPLGAVAQLIRWDTATPPVVVAADEDVVTFSTRLEALVAFEASFSFSVRDAIDEDYVPLGSEEVSTEEVITFEAVMTVARDMHDGIDLAEADVALSPVTVNFGAVEPFQSEDPTHEKY
ncbi:MAG: hypothetical protein EOS23_02930 [Mesorhizobium sp.]|nr:MAG: hypothetical protein EOS23_02930 [Mesorhizobium sp.]